MTIIENIEDAYFIQIAENMAHYHHERWNGTGYPENLTGEKIPLEARIMALADVYDALVSERCYKPKLSFEDAAKIIREGMGTHFDPALAEIFEACRPQLEAYYSNEAE
jgi:HD-GYP domain-containing protein (c-di-GMP phosphodiesterase class II)